MEETKNDVVDVVSQFFQQNSKHIEASVTAELSTDPTIFSASWNPLDTNFNGACMHPALKFDLIDGNVVLVVKSGKQIPKNSLMLIPIGYAGNGSKLHVSLTAHEREGYRTATALDSVFITEVIRTETLCKDDLDFVFSEPAGQSNLTWAITTHADDVIAMRRSPEEFHDCLAFVPRIASDASSANCVMVHGLIISTCDLKAKDKVSLEPNEPTQESKDIVKASFQHSTHGPILIKAMFSQYGLAINRTLNEKLVAMKLSHFLQVKAGFVNHTGLQLYYKLEKRLIKFLEKSTNFQDLRLAQFVVPVFTDANPMKLPYAVHHLTPGVDLEILLCPLINALEDYLFQISGNKFSDKFRMLHAVADTISLLQLPAPARLSSDRNNDKASREAHYNQWIVDVVGIPDQNSRVLNLPNKCIVEMLVDIHDPAQGSTEVLITTLEFMAGIFAGLMKEQYTVNTFRISVDPFSNTTTKAYATFPYEFGAAFCYISLSAAIAKKQDE
jgi:hypothetical protein